MLKNSWVFIFLSLIVCQSIDAQKMYETPSNHAAVVVGGSVGLVGGALLIEDRRGPLSISDIEALDGEMLNSFDKGTIDNYSLNAATASDYFKNGVFAAPLTLFLSGQGRENAKEILFLYGEVLSLNSGLTAITKSSFGRYRPYSYNPNVDLETKLGASTRRSFYSGHVSHVTSLSFFTATIFDDLYPDSDYRYAVWAGAIAAPAITGYLRVKAGRHFPTDVIVGYGVGALIGYFIPEFHKISKDSSINIIGAEGGLGLLYDF